LQAPEKIQYVNETAGDLWATPEEVALAMLDLIERDQCAAGQIAGGTILEVGKNQTRLVSERNDPGPTGPGHTVRGVKKAIVDAMDTISGEGWGKY
jgi:3-hydroxybutyrate dehydrogenase